MIILDTLTLPPTLVWSDRYGWSPVSQAVRRTLGGGLVVFHRALRGGRPVTLDAGQTWGWLSKEQVDALALMAAAPGAIYTLQWYGETHQVAFRHDEPPAFSAQPLRPQNPEPGPSTRFTGQIKLMTVEP